MNPAVAKEPRGRSAPGQGARPALVLLLLINLFNYVDRQVLAAVVPSIERSFFGGGERSPRSRPCRAGAARTSASGPSSP